MISRYLRTGTCWALLFAGWATLTFAQIPATTNVIGGRGGTPFQDSEIPRGARISEIHIYSGDVVDSLQIVYLLPDGRSLTSMRRGGPGGQQNVFRLDSGEYVVGISGRYGDYIDSIQIHTNRRVSSLYGGRGGSYEYRIDVPTGNQAVGFVGRLGRFIDAIGLIYSPIYAALTQTQIYGGSGGSPFSDTEVPIGATISELRVYAGNNLDGIQVVYALSDGRLLEGPMRGGTGGRMNVFRLDVGEYIIGISGRYGNYIDSLTLHTNRRTSQTFGGRGGSRTYQITIPSGNQVLGFTGRAGKYIDAIGLNYAPPSISDRFPQPRRLWRFRVQN